MMGIDKRGGFLQMFDWNTRSRNQLLPTKQNTPEQSKRKKRCEGNLQSTKAPKRAEHEIAGRLKGACDSSHPPSITDEDVYGTRQPGVVARLMGLDSLPKSTFPEPHSAPFIDSQSVRGSLCRASNLGQHQHQTSISSTLQDDSLMNGLQHQSVINRRLHKFQTEVKPPKSAKAVPVTQQKLLSPIKRTTYIPPEDAAQIMEAAARILESSPHTSAKGRRPSVGSSSAPLRLKELKEKVQVSQKPRKLFEASLRKEESGVFENLKELPMSKSWCGSLYGTTTNFIPNMQEKTITVEPQSKTNPQKRDYQKQACNFSHSRLLSGQSAVMKPSMQKGSRVLGQNDTRQSCVSAYRGKSSKCNEIHEETSYARQRASGRLNGATKSDSRKLSSDSKDENRIESCSNSQKITCRKRSIDGSYHSAGNQSFQEMMTEPDGLAGVPSLAMRVHSNWGHDINLPGSDVVSFTFTAPMKSSSQAAKVGDHHFLCSTRPQCKWPIMFSDSEYNCEHPWTKKSVNGADALSYLLEQKLKRLAEKVEFSKLFGDVQSNAESTLHPKIQQRAKDRMQQMDNQEVNDASILQARKVHGCRFPSPDSVLEHSSVGDICSSDTIDSCSTGIKQFSLSQTPEVLDLRHPKECLDADLSDSASSATDMMNLLINQPEALILTDARNSTRTWEEEFVKEMLYDIENAYVEYALGQSSNIVSPHVFDRLESRRKLKLDTTGSAPSMNPRILYDHLNESLDLRFKHFTSGGYKLWTEGLVSVRRKERLGREICKEICGWPEAGDSMIDDLLDREMSSQHGRWLDFDIEVFEVGVEMETQILNSLIDEVITDT